MAAKTASDPSTAAADRTFASRAYVTVPLQHTNLLMPFLFTILLLFIITAAGYAFLTPLLGKTPRHWAELAGLSFAGGCGIVGMILFCASLLGIRPGWITFTFIAFATTITLAILYRRRKLTPIKRPRPLPRTWDFHTIIGALAVAAILAATANVIIALLRPGIIDIDAFAIWMFKAKIVWLSALRPIPSALLDPSLSYSHQDYPLGFPLLAAQIYGLANVAAEHIAKLIVLPIYLSLIGVAYASMRQMLRRADAAVVTALLAAAPVTVRHAGVPVAEILFVLQHLCCLTLLLQWMLSNDRRYLIASAAFAVFAAFTKNEGLALLPLISLAMLAFSLARHQRKLLADWGISLLMSLLLLAPWLMYRRYLPRTHEDYGGKLTHFSALLQHLGRLPAILPRYLSYLFDPSQVGLIWIILIVAAIVGRRKFVRLPVMIMWTILLCHLALYALTFAVTPWDVNILLPMIAPKLLMHITPAAAILIGLHLAGDDKLEPHFTDPSRRIA